MRNDKLRRQIAHDAARLVYARQETEYTRAKWKAARRVCRGWVHPGSLPSNAEIFDQVRAFTRLFERTDRDEQRLAMRTEALRMLRMLHRFHPRLVGSTLSGQVRRGSDIDLHLFSDSVAAITSALDNQGIDYEVVRQTVLRKGVGRLHTRVLARGQFRVELTMYPARWAQRVFKSSIDGRAIDRMTLAEFEQFLAVHHPELNLADVTVDAEARGDRFQAFVALLLPLEQVRENARYHPESDALYHSLQVFDLAQRALPYDEEFLLAALLHDVGKAIDPACHVAAGLEALGDDITPRSAWLVEHLPEGQACLAGQLGARARRRLEAAEDFEELMLLARCDRQGRRPGVATRTVDQALDYLRQLAQMCEG